MIPELLTARRSVRVFRAETPPRSALLALIEAAIRAPSASNRQPWRFVIVTDRVLLQSFAATIERAVARFAGCVADPLRGSFSSYAAGFSSLALAPAVIVPLYRPVELLSPMLDAGGEDELGTLARELEAQAGLVSAAMAVENLLLAGPALGLGATVATGALLARPQLEELLGVHAPWHMLGLVAVGYPAESPAETPRKPAARVARFIPEEGT